ncbi:MAG TPA: hypothetical protein VKO16_08965 [Polyangia bacterium]|nr:hypothetical protein [Polyangia bacterium]
MPSFFEHRLRTAASLLPLATVALFAFSCASAPPAPVRIVRANEAFDYAQCEQKGRIAGDTAADPQKAEENLRTVAKAHGADTVILFAERTGAESAYAYRCRMDNVTAGRTAFGTANGTDGSYGPQTPNIQYSPAGAPQPVPSRN